MPECYSTQFPIDLAESFEPLVETNMYFRIYLSFINIPHGGLSRYAINTKTWNPTKNFIGL